MTLAELAALGLPQAPLIVPEWTLGCFRRRAITFSNGKTDAATRVIWLQSHGLTADLRLLPDRPALSGKTEIAQGTDQEVLALAEVEGGLATTAWDGVQMSWGGWSAFQLHDKWPEAAALRRVGDCLIEFAPSGVYVEDWRLQPSAPGLLVGLRLIEERDLVAQEVRHRGGGLVICGDHAALILGRPAPLAFEGRLPDLVRASLRDRGALHAIFTFETSYAVRNVVALSTLPWREGQPLMSLHGFSWEAERQEVVQRTIEEGRALERRFTIDTLRTDFDAVIETPATDEAQAWVERERKTLLSNAI